MTDHSLRHTHTHIEPNAFPRPIEPFAFLTFRNVSLFPRRLHLSSHSSLSPVFPSAAVAALAGRRPTDRSPTCVYIYLYWILKESERRGSASGVRRNSRMTHWKARGVTCAVTSGTFRRVWGCEYAKVSRTREKGRQIGWVRGSGRCFDEIERASCWVEAVRDDFAK